MCPAASSWSRCSCSSGKSTLIVSSVAVDVLVDELGGSSPTRTRLVVGRFQRLVAIALAVSWKPLVTSDTRAVPTVRITRDTIARDITRSANLLLPVHQTFHHLFSSSTGSVYLWFRLWLRPIWDVNVGVGELTSAPEKLGQAGIDRDVSWLEFNRRAGLERRDETRRALRARGPARAPGRLANRLRIVPSDRRSPIVKRWIVDDRVCGRDGSEPVSSPPPDGGDCRASSRPADAGAAGCGGRLPGRPPHPGAAGVRRVSSSSAGGGFVSDTSSSVEGRDAAPRRPESGRRSRVAIRGVGLRR